MGGVHRDSGIEELAVDVVSDGGTGQLESISPILQLGCCTLSTEVAREMLLLFAGSDHNAGFSAAVWPANRRDAPGPSKTSASGTARWYDILRSAWVVLCIESCRKIGSPSA